MDWTILSNLGSTIAVIAGVIFAVVQLRQFRINRERDAALELVHSYQTPAFARALIVLFKLPDGLDKKSIDGLDGADLQCLYAMMITFENLGVLVCRGEVSLELVDDLYSGPITLAWRKLGAYVLDMRKDLARETVWEWFQWLAERMMERETASAPVPAHEAFRDWKPPRK